ncbi:hypothetical protein [Cohnella hongkongensis]|uniref:Glycosyl hydrolase family 4 C-terminal domain-containing protein n=1 Tax=Cohnella hongkongensis TaxID=178337 RepID=A0ABV9FGU0_9BACL
MTGKKIVLVGAGSVVFTQGFIMDLLEQKNGQRWHLALVDTDADVLKGMQRLCQKMIAARGGDLQLSCSTDRKEVLSGADYVVSTIGVGGRRAWEQDVFISRKYGIFHPVGDSVGPGGISRAMRMIPAVVGLVEDMMVYCPQARFFNYSNPMTAIVRATIKKTGFPVIGLCHGVKNGQRRIARFAGLDPSRTTALAAGVNHMVFMYDLRCDGKDAWQQVRSQLERTKGSAQSEIGPLSRSVIETYGVYPVSDDRHYSEFTEESMLEGRYYGKTLGIDAYSFEGTIEYGDQVFADSMRLASSDSELPKEFFQRFDGEHEQLIEIIDSLERDERKIYHVNMPNGHALPELPADAVLELPAAATASGFKALQLPDFPGHLYGEIRKHIEIVEKTVDAGLSGDRELFLEAIMMGGYMADESQAAALTNELIEAQKRYLPQF